MRSDSISLHWSLGEAGGWVDVVGLVRRTRNERNQTSRETQERYASGSQTSFWNMATDKMVVRTSLAHIIHEGS